MMVIILFTNKSVPTFFTIEWYEKHLFTNNLKLN